MVATPRKKKAKTPCDPASFVFGFGKYNGLSFREVWEKDGNYIHWCAREGVLNLPTKMQHWGELGTDENWVNDVLGYRINALDEPVPIDSFVNSVPELIVQPEPIKTVLKTIQERMRDSIKEVEKTAKQVIYENDINDFSWIKF